TGRVFAVKSTGGSMLVDCSGSMAWNRDMLAAAMEKLPRLWAGMYTMHADHMQAMQERGRRLYGAKWAQVYGQPSPFLQGNVSKLCVVAAEGRLGELPNHESCPGHTH